MATASSSIPLQPARPGLLRSWAARLRLASPAAGGPRAPTGIGITGLPDSVRQLPLQVPVALIAADASSAALWFPAALEDALAAGPVALVAASAPWVDSLLQHPPIRAAYQAGQLRLWLLAPGLATEVRHHGLDPLLEELERTGLEPGHALYLCDAHDLLADLGGEALTRLGRQLNALSQRRQHPVVLGFATAPPPQALRKLCPLSLHTATVRSDGDRWSLEWEHWNTLDGALARTAFGLDFDASSQRLTANGTRIRAGVNDGLAAADQAQVIATRASVEGQRGVPGHWRIVESLADMEVAAATSVAATLLIDAGQTAEFETRARLVHQLRLSRPLSLKIVVRENLIKLRAHSEQALLQLGASAVVYKEVGFSRLLQMLQDMAFQSHTRAIQPDYVQALNSFMPSHERGYQAPERFCTLAREILDRTQSVGLTHCLVQLNLLPRMPHIDALRACQTSRGGDLVTADHESIYLFLFGCREPDVEPVLQRLFALPPGQLFESQAVDGSDPGIRSMLARLQDSLRKGVPDYSTALDSSRPLAPVAMPTATPLPDRPQRPTLASPAVAPATAPAKTPAVGPVVQHRPIARRASPPISTRTTP